MNLSLLALEEVKSLDDHVIFLGETTVLSYSAAELGYTKGCVYFTISDEMSLYKYEVDDKSLFLSLPCSDLPSPRFSSNWMMIPSTLRSADAIQKTHYIKCKKDEEDSSRNAEESKIGAKMVEADLIQKLNGGELQEARAWGWICLEVFGLELSIWESTCCVSATHHVCQHLFQTVAWRTKYTFLDCLTERCCIILLTQVRITVFQVVLLQISMTQQST
ncbi:hypothetical protein MKW98_005184 [Papaver atlanticum]|uniref:KIB1-4 beta-propeller domain-containing protein n=1 Tax=Papaver atlanticum TaxID=357466 RepID=A0AAD4RWV1_9MAGN|nr:hypothetical protein MKW98_005184 [Papaver atlanticum]